MKKIINNNTVERNLKLLLISNFLIYFGFNIWRNLFNNYAVETIGAEGFDIGLIQSVREVPGLLGFLIAFIVLVINKVKLSHLCVIVLGSGIILVGMSDDTASLTLSTMLMSFGFHYFMTTNKSIIFSVLPYDDAATTISKFAANSQLAGVVANVVIFLAFFLPKQYGWFMKYEYILYSVGIFILAIGSIVMFRSRKLSVKTTHKKVVYRKEYWLFYTLMFLGGTRRHIFTTFAIFLLVKNFNVNIEYIAILIFINNLIGTYIFKYYGNIIRKFGERKVLATVFFSLIFIFSGYATLNFLPILYVLFVIDHLLFGFNMAINTYLKKIARPEDIIPNTSAGDTINHISAVVIPLIGGLVWDTIGFQVIFIFGGFVALITFLFSLKIK